MGATSLPAELRERGAGAGPGAAQGTGAPGVRAPGSSGRPSAERGRESPAEPPRVGAQCGLRPARPGARGKVTPAAAAAPALGAALTGGVGVT